VQGEAGPQDFVATEDEEERTDSDAQPGQGTVVRAFRAGAAHPLGSFMNVFANAAIF
jgi:hypothetical protein